MKKRTAGTIVILITIIFAISCTHSNVEKQLDYADVLMRQEPERALEVLDSIPQSELDYGKEKARYALLYSMALAKNYIDVTSDSLTGVAVRWYRRHGTADEKLKAYYYNGRVFQNAGDEEKAMESFFHAERYAEKSKDAKQKGLLFLAKASIYNALFRNAEAIKNAATASALFLSARDTSNYIVSQIELCSFYLGEVDIAKGEQVISTLESYVPCMSSAQASNYFTMKLHIANAKNDVIEQVISEYLQYVRDPKDINWGIVAVSYTQINKYDLALNAFEQHRRYNPGYEEDSSYYLLLSKLYKSMGQFEEALDACNNYIEVQSDDDVEIFESDAKFVEDRMLAEYKIRNRNLLIALLVLGVISSVSVGLLVYYKLKENIRKKQQEQERLEKEKIEIEKEKESYRQLYEMAQQEKKNLMRIKREPKLNKEIKECVEERLNVLNNFITASVAKNLSVSANEELNNYLKDRDRFIYSTRLSFVMTRPKFIAYLKKCGLTETEIGYCCLYCIGMNGNEISTYLGRKSFYNVSGAIRKKLGLDKNDAHLDHFLREKMLNAS